MVVHIEADHVQPEQVETPTIVRQGVPAALQGPSRLQSGLFHRVGNDAWRGLKRWSRSVKTPSCES